MLQSKAGIENKEYKAQRSILADVDAGKISREDFFARAEELLKERLNASAAEAPRPAHPAPVVAAKTPAKVPAAASKTPVSESPEMVLAMATQVTVERKLENEPAEWEKGLQMRLMELDVDPGHDCEPGFSNASGV
jgi:hypothetical protein